MATDSIERRHYKRYIFSASEETTGAFSLADAEGPYDFTAHILNISEGGLGLAMPKSLDRIRPGSMLVFAGAQGKTPLGFLSGTKMKIRWLQDIPRLNYKLFGCEFIDATADMRLQIKEMIGRQSP